MNNIAHAFDRFTGEYIGPVEMQCSPLEPGVFLQPANTQLNPPPSLQANQVACVVDDEWVVKADFRGTWFKPNREIVEITEIDVVADNAWSLTEPVKTLNDIKAEKNAEINLARLEANQRSFTHSGKAFACDHLSRSDIDGINGYVGTRNALPPNWVGGWKAADNSILIISDVSAWNAFYDSMIAQGQSNFMHSQQLKAQLAAAGNADEVAVIVW